MRVQIRRGSAAVYHLSFARFAASAAFVSGDNYYQPDDNEAPLEKDGPSTRNKTRAAPPFPSDKNNRAYVRRLSPRRSQ